MRIKLVVLALVTGALFGCSGNGLFGGRKNDQISRATGWAYNDPAMGNIPYVSGYEQEAGPGLVFIEGGTFTMGRVDEDVMGKWDNMPRRVTVASFYMDETEVSNQMYREYIYWLARVYPNDREKMNAALPDTLQWRDPLAYNEPYIQNYFRHPAYSDYPVVGVSWNQANAYSSWRTDRVNELRLINAGIIEYDPNQSGENVFTTDTYLAGLYQGVSGRRPQTSADGTVRPVRWEDGILLPKYRLPTEAEWEYAALALRGNTNGDLLSERRMYPWDGTHLRVTEGENKGIMVANFTRGRGDLMTSAAALNGNADITAPVFSYLPNDFGLYNMAGNVSEWVYDVYRPLSFMDVGEFQPVRGNVFTAPRRDANGNLVRNQYGEMLYDTLADYRNYRDGDPNSQIIEGNDWISQSGSKTTDMYIKDDRPGYFSSLVGDDVRVYKGGSWKDRPYWLSPGTRRFKHQDESANDIGFRLAMTRVGSPSGL